MFQLTAIVASLLFLLVVLLANGATADDAKNATSDAASCTMAMSVEFARIKFPDCVVAGVDAVILTHVISDEQTASYPGEFSLEVTGDWGDGTTPVTQVKAGFVGGQNHTTEWNHTYATAGSYQLNFTFTTRQKPNEPDLDCLALTQSDSRVNTIDVHDAGPDACVPPPTPLATSQCTLSLAWHGTLLFLLLVSSVVLR